MWRYDVFTWKLAWYFTGVKYVINRFILGSSSGMIHSASFLSKDACTQEIYICNEFIRKTSLTVTSVYINE